MLQFTSFKGLVFPETPQLYIERLGHAGHATPARFQLLRHRRPYYRTFILNPAF